jgi:hypothetical protein
MDKLAMAGLLNLAISGVLDGYAVSLLLDTPAKEGNLQVTAAMAQPFP